MHKVIAEALASLIPIKMTRNRMRGILRFGLINVIKLKAELNRNHDKPTKYYLAICAIAKNEGAYFQEWIQWHKELGVEKFYIYDNDSTDDTKDVLAPYIESGLVEYKFLTGKKQQLAAYDHCLLHYRFDMKWLAVIDLDEFIVPVKDKNLKDFLIRFEAFSAVQINWLIYGSGGAKHKESGGVMERFKFHATPQYWLNKSVKSIVNPRRIYTFTGCHEAANIFGEIADSHGNIIKKSFKDREPQQDVIRINHYAVKSYDEFLEKKARGRATKTHKQRSVLYFNKYDLNDIKE